MRAPAGILAIPDSGTDRTRARRRGRQSRGRIRQGPLCAPGARDFAVCGIERYMAYMWDYPTTKDSDILLFLSCTMTAFSERSQMSSFHFSKTFPFSKFSAGGPA